MRSFAIAQTIFLSVALLMGIAGVSAGLGAEYVKTSPGLIGTTTIGTSPDITYIYAISYAAEPSVWDTTYVYVRDDIMVAAVQPGETWTLDAILGNSLSSSSQSIAGMVVQMAPSASGQIGDLTNTVPATIPADDAEDSEPESPIGNASYEAFDWDNFGS